MVIKLYQNLKKINNNISVGKKFYEDQIDEEILLRKKTNLIVDKNRQKIIQRAINENKKILIFDDGLQDRNITYDLEFVCFDAETWIGNGFLIPSGPSLGPQPKRILNILNPSFKYFSASICRSLIGWLYNFDA